MKNHVPIRTPLPRMMTALLWLLGGYGLLLLAGCTWQRKLLYFPARSSPEVAVAAAAESGLIVWRNAVGEIVGWKREGATAPTARVLIMHGNAGAAWQRDYLAHPIAAAAAEVYVLEYPGYGARGGAPGLNSFLAAGEAAVRELPDDLPLYVVSESIGTGVAAHLARTFPQRIAGLALLVPYDSLPRVAQAKMPWLLPQWFLRDRFEPAEWLRDYHGPIVVVVAERDEVIPPEAGQRLFAAYAGPKRLEIIPGARHNDVAAQAVAWWESVFAFWRTNTAGGGPP